MYLNHYVSGANINHVLGYDKDGVLEFVSLRAAVAFTRVALIGPKIGWYRNDGSGSDGVTNEKWLVGRIMKMMSFRCCRRLVNH